MGSSIPFDLTLLIWFLQEFIKFVERFVEPTWKFALAGWQFLIRLSVSGDMFEST